MASLTGELHPSAPNPWLVSARWDVAVFGGSALLSALLLGWGWARGLLNDVTPVWAWVVAVVLVDVAHVWATAYRIYTDPEELARRPGLYFGAPGAAYVVGVVLYSGSPELFWTVLAYLAVFHFVRQQYGWVSLYRHRSGQTSKIDRWLDDLTIYSATLYPLIYWHSHLPREFEWFIEGDFIPGLPPQTAAVLLPVHLAITVAYVSRQLLLMATGRTVSVGKNLVMGATWLAWFGGIVLLNSDYAFTVTNVFIHGIPYIALIWIYSRSRYRKVDTLVSPIFRSGRWLMFLLPLLVVGLSEEWLWDRLVWHEHGAIFPGSDVVLSLPAATLVVPLLALPQAAHYVLDAWIWRVRPGENPGLKEHLGLA